MSSDANIKKLGLTWDKKAYQIISLTSITMPNVHAIGLITNFRDDNLSRYFFAPFKPYHPNKWGSPPHTPKEFGGNYYYHFYTTDPQASESPFYFEEGHHPPLQISHVRDYKIGKLKFSSPRDLKRRLTIDLSDWNTIFRAIGGFTFSDPIDGYFEAESVERVYMEGTKMPISGPRRRYSFNYNTSEIKAYFSISPFPRMIEVIENKQQLLEFIYKSENYPDELL